MATNRPSLENLRLVVEGGVNPDVLAQTMRLAGHPVHINVLARAAVRTWVEAGVGVRHYAPGARYQAGETVMFGDQHATVRSVQEGDNPIQGPFSVLTLALPDGTERLMAAEVPGAPAGDRQPVTETRVDEVQRTQGAAIRRAVQATLAADPRFILCQTLQGDLWCLVEMLPQVDQDNLQKALTALPNELLDEEPVSRTTEELARAIWGLEDDGSDTYALHAFALSLALHGHDAVVNLGDRWASARAWETFTGRPALEGPRMPSLVALPEGVEAATRAQIKQEQRREAAGEGEEPEVEEPAEKDLETWRQDHPTHTVFTLQARHYYEGWLPLSGQVWPLFPPLASGQQEVIFHHHFGDEPESFRAWVDQEKGRVWVSREMYETLRRHRIYPGARLRLSARNEREYDIAPRETDRTDPIRVWRIWLDEEGRIQYDNYEEPRRYDVADDIYVADVRFEDREALFRQAGEVGNSIFGLMYQKAVEQWEAGGRKDLVITADQLFEAVHFDEQGRMTSKATIAWELWRRLAFEPVGGGRYRFRPEFGDLVRSTGPTLRRRSHRRPTEPTSRLTYRPPSEEPPAPTLERTRTGQLVAAELVPPGPLFKRPMPSQESEAETSHPTSLDEPGDEELQSMVDAEFRQIKEIVRASLVGKTIYTLVQAKPNRIIDADDEGLTVAARNERKLPWEWIKDVYKALCHLGEIESKDVQEGEFRSRGGYRCAFVFPLLAQFAHIEAHIKPRRRLVYHKPEGPIQLYYTEIEAVASAHESRKRGSTEEGAAQAQNPLPDSPLPSSQEPTGPPPPSQPPPSPSRPSPRPKRSRPSSKPLFSQHYLTRRIQEHPEWSEDVAAPFEQLRALYEQKREILPTLNEAQTEAEFIRPALEILGFAYIPQTLTRRAGRVQRPDYALFTDEAAKSEAYPLQSDEPAFYARTLAIADAKYWERSLSETRRDDPRDVFKNTNPSFQIVNYLTGTGVDWGILTNGRLWRLYWRQASSTATEFYEVDLVEALESGDPSTELRASLERFKYFWLFFRRDAFIRDAQGCNFLERVREGSATYARMVGDRLKERVFEEVFPFLSGGFVAHRAARGEDVTGEEARRAIYEATLSLLYKMLFLLYAEARDLLPISNPGYRAQSLTRMAREVAERIVRAEPLGRTSTALYDHLLNLFRLIDRGDSALGLPRYNGGLFHFDFDHPSNQEKHRANRFLTRHKVPDAFLAPALDLLYRANGEPVDYGFIGVRHLGAIYEGLLEHRLAVEEPDKTSEVSEDLGGLEHTVHLETDKGERKATGSYYTPDYVVKYIVRHTLGPILEQRARRFDDLMGRIAGVRRQLADGRRGSASIRTLRGELERLERQAREALLDIKICDPAMGSGHFLVEAVDFLTDGLIEILNRYPDHNPVLAMLDRIRRDIVASLERQGIPVDPARLDDTQLLQRVVMKRCIYGVDLNPMAVELAKVSLWLHSFTIGAPLSFLDHHLRCGNSLIGATVREAEAEMAKPGDSGQLTFLTGPFAGLLRAAEIMRGISLLSDATFAEVEESERLFRQFDDAAKPYKRLLDIFVARHFGVKRADEFLRLYGADAIQAGPEGVGEPYAAVMRQARQLYEEKRFFHWDLEFPEVFIDLERATWKENPGFDVVVGNPPYGFVADKTIQAAFSKQYVAVSSYDLYVAFLERGVQVLGRRGILSYIAPTSWQTGIGYRDFRAYALRTCQIAQIVNLPYDVFPDAYIDTSIYVLRKERDFNEISELLGRPVWAYEFGKREKAAQKLLSALDCWQLASQDWFNDEQLRFVVDRGVLQLRGALARVPTVALGEITDSARGILAGESDLSSKRVSDDWKPYFDGDIYRYQLLWEPSTWVRYGLNLREMPGSYSYFTGPRVLVRRLISRQARLMATYVSEEFVSKKDLYSILAGEGNYSELALLALLNSQLYSHLYIAQSMVASRDDFPQVTLADLRKLPIPRIAFTTPPDERARLVEEGLNHEEREMARMTRNAQDPFVPFAAFRAFRDSELGHWLDARLSAQPEQSDVVHDLLAHLAEQMIEMNKEKQAEVKGFLAWLEREIGAPIDNLTRKTYLRNYLGDYQKGKPHLTLEELLDILRRNRRRLQVDPTARAFQERLAREYQASLDKLLPLKTHLAATDRLIDLIVYRLYGLRQEEVAIVEDNAP